MIETISHEEIKRIKEEFVLRNTLLSPVKVAGILGYSVSKIYKMVECGQLETATANPGRTGMRITALSVDRYRADVVKKGGE